MTGTSFPVGGGASIRPAQGRQEKGWSSTDHGRTRQRDDPPPRMSHQSEIRAAGVLRRYRSTGTVPVGLPVRLGAGGLGPTDSTRLDLFRPVQRVSLHARSSLDTAIR